MGLTSRWTFKGYWERVLPLIESRLREVVEEGELSGLYRYVVEGGKRLRPTLALLISEALGGDSRMALDLGCSVELTHCASLALDDILDWHEERRGKVALHRLKGLRTAVTTGFTMPSLALNLAARYGVEYPKRLTDAWVSMCLGVHMEDDLGGASWEDYERSVELKTGRLFAAACLFGARAARRRDGGFEEYGLHLGMAFQMADDLVDGGGRDGEALGDRLERRMEGEVRAAVEMTSHWQGKRPELIDILRDAPRVIVSLKRRERREGS
ncbi:MAG: polyprenyl synthetase family protein [Thermoplasmata archaeon]